MATKAKEGSQLKAKKATSPSLASNADATARRKSLNPGTTSAAVPSYIRATKSSSLDSPKKEANKRPTSSATTTMKPTALSTRRSFNKPSPPNLQVQKPAGGTTVRGRTVRPSSFTATNNFSKPRTPLKDVEKPQSRTLRNASTKKANTTTVYKPKSNVGSSSSTKSKTAQTLLTAMNEAQNVRPKTKVEPLQSDQESSVTDVAENSNNNVLLNDVESSNEMEGDDIFNPDGADQIDMLDDEILESDDGSETKLYEPSSLISEEDATGSSTNEPEKMEDEIPVEENVNNTQEVEHEQEDNNAEKMEHNEDNNDNDEGITQGKTTETEEQAEETESNVINAEDNTMVDKEEVSEANVEPKVEVTADNRIKSDKINHVSATKPHAGGQGNKKDSAAYNDVIEETATKLRQQRKNKVLALVGAFETVISLQDTES